MNLYLRLLYTIFISWRQGPAAMGDAPVLTFRTWPHDLDLNLHMNNGRYLTLMDLGRVQLMLRLGLGGKIARGGWMPVIGTVHMRYRRSLPPFKKFSLETRIVAWDEKWFYLEQRFLVGRELMATGLVKGLFRAKDGVVPTPEVLAAAGQSPGPSGPIPDVFQTPASQK